MGVKGLLLSLKSVQRPCKISEFSGTRVAIDGFAWLHRAAYANLHKAVVDRTLGREAINFCLKRARLLTAYGVKPFFVFDGRSLPAKAATNAERRDARTEAKERVDLHLAAGDKQKAHKAMGQAVAITWPMVVDLMQALRAIKVEFMVAPYEADAQLGYLSITGFVSAVISEDSDLLLYGCSNVLFKMDEQGNCVHVRGESLVDAGLLPAHLFSLEILIVICALSGCDYTKGVSGIGLKKGAQVVEAALQRLRRKRRFEGQTRLREDVTTTDEGGDENRPVTAVNQSITEKGNSVVCNADSSCTDPTFTSDILPVDMDVAASNKEMNASEVRDLIGEVIAELRYKGLDAPEDFASELFRAFQTFRCQTVFDVLRNEPTSLTALEQLSESESSIANEKVEDLRHLGEILPGRTLFELARGVLDPKTLQAIPAMQRLLGAELPWRGSETFAREAVEPQKSIISTQKGLKRKEAYKLHSPRKRPCPTTGVSRKRGLLNLGREIETAKSTSSGSTIGGESSGKSSRVLGCAPDGTLTLCFQQLRGDVSRARQPPPL